MAHRAGPASRRLGRGPLAVLVVAGLAAALPVSGLFGVGPFTGLRGSAAGSPNPSPVGLAASSPAVVEPTASPEPTPVFADIPIVPVTQFRAPWDGVDSAEVAAVLAGTSDHYAALELVASDSDAAIAALAVARPADPARLVLAPDAATLRSDLAANRDRLAFLRLADVDPSVRALRWDGAAAFGVGHVATIDAWPLSIRVLLPDEGSPGASAPRASPGGTGGSPQASGATTAPLPDSPPYDPATAWVLVAAGDVMLDRGVADEVKNVRKDVDFPFDGGTAEITGRHCCSSLGNRVPDAERTGNEGAVRALFEGADLAITNFENPAPDAFRYHSEGTVFSADPALLATIANAGIDWVSLANNHIRDFGAQGVLDTITNLNRWGIAHGGAGADLATARAPTILAVGSTRVGILGYDTIAPSYAATADRAGSAQMTAETVKEDVARARELGADVVIVFPHWGVEYSTGPTEQQLRLGHAAIDAGADLVIGNHPHWAGAVEIYQGKPIFYALGNLIFDQTWSEPTLEGISVEMTFAGARLVQVRIRPHLILDRSQPNFMLPSGSGEIVMDQVFEASEGYLPW
ncbi:MAG TPA: CapA family protein [Candidatus Limnocylindrales bacterium]|nr:CapA family protein [Candidatus Limnocylindrales bacterium]